MLLLLLLCLAVSWPSVVECMVTLSVQAGLITLECYVVITLRPDTHPL